ncbi:MAG: hypothetical protein ACOYB8_01900 [Eubacteriaceae bacterium]|jgi:hypothetical protein
MSQNSNPFKRDTDKTGNEQKLNKNTYFSYIEKEKDYDRLDDVFQKAVIRSRHQRIKTYASERRNSLKEQRQKRRDVYKTNPRLETVSTGEINTKLVNLTLNQDTDLDSWRDSQIGMIEEICGDNLSDTITTDFLPDLEKNLNAATAKTTSGRTGKTPLGGFGKAAAERTGKTPLGGAGKTGTENTAKTPLGTAAKMSNGRTSKTSSDDTGSTSEPSADDPEEINRIREAEYHDGFKEHEEELVENFFKNLVIPEISPKKTKPYIPPESFDLGLISEEPIDDIGEIEAGMEDQKQPGDHTRLLNIINNLDTETSAPEQKTSEQEQAEQNLPENNQTEQEQNFQDLTQPEPELSETVLPDEQTEQNQADLKQGNSNTTVIPVSSVSQDSEPEFSSDDTITDAAADSFDTDFGINAGSGSEVDNDEITETIIPENVRGSAEASISEPQAEPEAKTPVVVKSFTEDKELRNSAIGLGISLLILLGFTLYFRNSFLAADWIVLGVLITGMILTCDLHHRNVLVFCGFTFALLIFMLLYGVYVHGNVMGLYNYLWFLIIPICLQTSYAFINNYACWLADKRKLKRQQGAQAYIDEDMNMDETELFEDQNYSPLVSSEDNPKSETGRESGSEKKNEAVAGQDYSSGTDSIPDQNYSAGQDNIPEQDDSAGQDSIPGQDYFSGQDSIPDQGYSTAQDSIPDQSSITEPDDEDHLDWIQGELDDLRQLKDDDTSVIFGNITDFETDHKDDKDLTRELNLLFEDSGKLSDNSVKDKQKK